MEKNIKKNVFPCAIQQDLVVHSFYINNLHLITQNSQFILLPPTLETITLFSMSLNLFMFCRYVHLCRISDFFKFYFIFKLYNIVLVLPNIKMNPPQVYKFQLRKVNKIQRSTLQHLTVIYHTVLFTHKLFNGADLILCILSH